MPELPEERKRQIRAEEEAKLRAEQAAEQQYREQVRKEFETEGRTKLEQQYREQVRADLVVTPAPASVVQPSSKTPSPAPAPKPRSPGRMRRLVPVLLLMGGLVSAGLAFDRGFGLPFIGAPREIILEAEDLGELAMVEEDSFIGSEVPATTSLTSAPPAPMTPRPPSPRSAAPPASATSSTRRATLKGTGTSIEVPPGWFVESGGIDDVLEIRWRDTGVASGHEEVVAYVLLQKEALGPGEPLEEWAERMVEQVADAASPEERIRFERDEVIPDFHGIPALSMDIITRGFLPYHMRNYYWALGGDGYILTCYATAGTFEERAPAFDRMVNSIRFSRERR